MFTSQGGADGRRESFEYRVKLFAAQRSAIPLDYAEILHVASSSAPFPMEPPSIRATYQQQRRLFPALISASVVAGLVLGNLIRFAACKDLSIFSLFSDNCVLENIVRILASPSCPKGQ